MMAMYHAQPRPMTTAEEVVKRIGRDPAALHKFVHDNTVAVPYLGSLRGVAGMLVDRTGNACDRSLLLAKLLTAADYEARLVHGKLPEARLVNIGRRCASNSGMRGCPPMNRSPARSHGRSRSKGVWRGHCKSRPKTLSSGVTPNASPGSARLKMCSTPACPRPPH